MEDAERKLRENWTTGWQFLQGAYRTFEGQLRMMNRPDAQKVQLRKEFLYRLIMNNRAGIASMGEAYRKLQLEKESE